MTPEDRLRRLLADAATDPGTRQDWDSFLQVAHRDRFVHRALILGTAAAIVVLVAIGSLLVDNVLDRTAPKPADKDKRTEKRLEEQIDNTEDRVRRTKDLVEDINIGPGPNKPPGDDTKHEEAPVVHNDRTGGHHGNSKRDHDTAPVTPTHASCRGETATIVGTDGEDKLVGTSGPDIIAALGGDDTIKADDGLDTICGGEGNDHLFGGPARDSLVGGLGDDYLDGGEGFDFVHFPTATGGININFEHHFIEGDGEDDVYRVEGAAGTGSVDNFAGDEGPNFFSAGAGNDAINGFGGDDVFFPGAGNDAMLGHAGRDTVSFTGTGGVRVDLDNNLATGEGVDNLDGIENINGTFGDDVISGNEQPNSFYGGYGNDSLSGGGGDDVLIGFADNDTLDGGVGADALDGGQGTDTCTNGESKKGCERSGPLGGFLIVGLLALLWKRGKRTAPR